MKKVFLFFAVILLFGSCITSRGNYTKNPDVAISENYKAAGRVEGVAFMPKLWILFIPIGGMSDQGLYNLAYKNAMKQSPEADGVTSQIVEYKKVKIPLLLVTFVNKHVNVSGTAYKIVQ